MAINFPSNPANNQTYSYNSSSWYWANNYGIWLANTTTGVQSTNATSQVFTGNGSNTIFTLSASINNSNNIIVTLDGLVQIPNTNYTISSSTLTFNDAPINATVIEVRNFENGTGSSSGTTTISDSVSPFLLMGA